MVHSVAQEGSAVPTCDGSKTVADILTAAADLIEPEGAWTQETYGVPAEGGSYSCLCLYGAICEAIRTAEADDRLEDRAFYTVRRLVGENPIGWNDTEGRTQAEVVAALRAAAEKARTAVEGPSVGTQGEARSEPKNTPANGDSQ